MPFSKPTLKALRELIRDDVASSLDDPDAVVPNSPGRVISDANAALAAGLYLYVTYLATQFLPDTAEDDALLRWVNIFLGGPKAATFATGSVSATGSIGAILPLGSLLAGAQGQQYRSTAGATMSGAPVDVPIVAIEAGAAGNLSSGATLQLAIAISGIEGTAYVTSLAGGVDPESQDSQRDRVLARIRRPPMGGDADDYVAWAREVPGVTRAWCSPNEMGPGTVTIRFMMDDLRSGQGGFPNSDDVAIVQAHIDQVRPVGMRDCFVASPIPEPISFTITDLVIGTVSVRAAIAVNVAAMLRERAAPARAVNGIAVPATTIHREWVSAAILATAGVESFELAMLDHHMPTSGSMAVLGTIS